MTAINAMNSSSPAWPETAWDNRGLLPAVVQDARDGTILMVAWMNREAFDLTRETGLAHFYSRSRKALWKKGETSGNTIAVQEIRLDCDADTIALIGEPTGPACHTGQRSCFYRVVDEGELIADGGPFGVPSAVAAELERVMIARRDGLDPEAVADKSYTRSLLDGGAPRILAKIAEEHGELAAELPAGPTDKVVHETADLLFHVMVGLVWRGVSLDDVWTELARRFGVSGHAEKAARTPS
jgi:phosphoribosyl-ATP pyrophosphohydrolase/phosphoribosyl-AMP cyclohydrolase